MSQRMKSERNKFAVSPYRLLSKHSFGNNVTSTEATIVTESKSNTKSNVTTVIKSVKLDDAFVQRYEAEIAAPNKMEEYNSIALKHKQQLFQESTQLHRSFNSKQKQLQSMESNVEDIHVMLNKFLTIIESQSEQLVDIHDVSKEATASVVSVNKELNVTIERNQSYQYNMVMLIVILSFLLLILDYITP